MKNIFKTLSRLESILLATTAIATSAAGYNAYTSYNGVQQVQELSAKVQNIEEERDTYRQQLKSERLEKADINAKLQDQIKDNAAYEQQLKVLNNMNLAAEKKLNSQAETISDLKSSKTTYTWNIPTTSSAMSSSSASRPTSRILSKEEALATLDNVFNSSSSSASSVSASSSTSTPVYYAQTPSAQDTPSTNNADRILYLSRELSYVDSQISLCKANYSAAIADAQSTYNSYSEQAQQAYVDYMMQKKNSGDTATEQLRLDTAQSNQRALGQQASDAKAVIDDLNEAYEDAIDALEDYRDEIVAELNSLQ